jgi:hypothetical protein
VSLLSSKRLSFLLPILALVGGCASSADSSEEPTSTSSSNLTDDRVWHSVVRCDGVHVDEVDPHTGYGSQLVIENADAARYLREKLNQAMAHDPFASQVTTGADIYGPLLKPTADNEMLWSLYGINQPRNDFFVQQNVTSGQEIRLELRKYTWEQDLGGGLFKKFTDMQLRLVRNGWQGWQCTPGLSGDPDSCGPTGQGWNEWEIANWTFRGCHNE